jgi:hypothetical protein
MVPMMASMTDVPFVHASVFRLDAVSIQPENGSVHRHSMAAFYCYRAEKLLLRLCDDSKRQSPGTLGGLGNGSVGESGVTSAQCQTPRELANSARRFTFCLQSCC